ncbi:WD40-repeat-containing domain protein [Gorgonomyces haynaldii]|nr:WD40-repeat-containing domain protein [Gorgonomyces haynaldii]
MHRLSTSSDIVRSRPSAVYNSRASIFGAHLLKRKGIRNKWSSSASSWSSFLRMMERFGSNRTLTHGSSVNSLSSMMHLVFFASHLPPLPYELVVSIFSYLTAQELSRMTHVCISLSVVAMDADLWQIHCIRDRVPCGPGIELLWDRCEGNRGKWWREIYIEWATAKLNWESGKHKKRLISLVQPSDALTCFKFDVDKIVVGTQNNNLYLFVTDNTAVWDMPQLLPSISFENGHTSPIMCLDFCTNVMASGDTHGVLCLWNLLTGDLMAIERHAHSKGLSCIKMIDDYTLITVGYDKTVRLFEMDEFKSDSSSADLEQKDGLFSKFWKRPYVKKRRVRLRQEMRGHHGDIYCLELMASEKAFATGSTDNSIKKIWSLSQSKCIKTLKGHTGIVTSLSYHEQVLFSGSVDKTIRKWNPLTGQCLTILFGHTNWVKSIFQTNDYVLSGGWDEHLRVFDKSTHQLKYSIPLLMGPITNIECNQNRVACVCKEDGFKHQLVIADFGRNIAGFWGELEYKMSKQ